MGGEVHRRQSDQGPSVLRSQTHRLVATYPAAYTCLPLARRGGWGFLPDLDSITLQIVSGDGPGVCTFRCSIR